MDKPLAVLDNVELNINEHFGPTIQGEGPLIGYPCFFLRFHHCPVKCPGCFIGKTSIRMADYSEKRISDVKLGDMVLSFDTTRGRFIPGRVTAVLPRKTREVYRIQTGLDRFTFVTSEHPILVRGRGWVEVKDLKIGDHILHLSNSEIRHLHNPMKDPAVAAQVGVTNKIRNATARANGTAINPWDRTPAATKERISRRMTNNNPMKDPAVAIKGFTNRHDRGKMSRAELFIRRISIDLGLRFIGDGSLIVSNKAPDFIIEDTKKLIEVWDASQTERLKRGDEWMVNRRELFAKEGYEVLFLPVTPYEQTAGARKKHIGEAAAIEIARVRKEIIDFKHNGKVVQGLEIISPTSHPKSWVRLAGSLLAELDVFNFEVEGTHTYIANSMVVHNCDTGYTWNGTEHGTKKTLAEWREYIRQSLVKYPGVGVVITGGEPLINYRNPAFAELLSRIGSDGNNAVNFLSLETSGFVGPNRITRGDVEWELLERVIVEFTDIAISPKITPCLHGEGWTDDELEINIDTIIQMTSTNQQVVLKFVVDTQDDIDAVIAFRKRHKAYVQYMQTYLMPYGQERDEILKKCEWLVEAAAKNGFVITPRLHSLIWGKERNR